LTQKPAITWLAIPGVQHHNTDEHIVNDIHRHCSGKHNQVELEVLLGRSVCEPYTSTPINLKAMANDFSNYILVEPTTIMMLMFSEVRWTLKVQKGEPENNWQLSEVHFFWDASEGEKKSANSAFGELMDLKHLAGSS
jgi:hypothetical protein